MNDLRVNRCESAESADAEPLWMQELRLRNRAAEVDINRRAARRMIAREEAHAKAQSRKEKPLIDIRIESQSVEEVLAQLQKETALMDKLGIRPPTPRPSFLTRCRKAVLCAFAALREKGPRRD